MKKFKRYNSKKTQKWIRSWHSVELTTKETNAFHDYLQNTGIDKLDYFNETFESAFTSNGFRTYFFARKNDAAYFKLMWVGE